MYEHLKDEILKLQEEGHFPGFINDHLNAPDRYKYETEEVGLFFMNAFHAAIEEYYEDHDWLKMAKGLWAAYSSYVGLGYSEEPVMKNYNADPLVVKLYRESKETSNTLLARFFEASFDLLYRENPTDAVAVMQQILKKIRIVRATEASLTRGQGKNIEMYDYFLTLIDVALAAPRPIEVDTVFEAPSVHDGLKTFCIMKIDELDAVTKATVLSTRKRCKKITAMKKAWLDEFNTQNGVIIEYKTSRASISRAISHHRGLTKK